jgi:CRISPR-associated protein Csa3
MGLGKEDSVHLLRPRTDSDTGRAVQAVADVEELLQEIEPEAYCQTERLSVDTFEDTIRECCSVLQDVEEGRELIVSLSGGARDILLPLTVASLVFANEIDHMAFFSDLDSTVSECSLPALSSRVPNRVTETFDHIVNAGGWITLSKIAEETGKSKSTIIRHVNELEDSGVIESDTTQREKRVRIEFTGELLSIASVGKCDTKYFFELYGDIGTATISYFLFGTV